MKRDRRVASISSVCSDDVFRPSLNLSPEDLAGASKILQGGSNSAAPQDAR